MLYETIQDKTFLFLGSDSYPGRYDRYGEKMAKVYRLTFAYQPESAAALNEKWNEPLPQTLANPFIKDVSNEYFKGTTLTIKLSKSLQNRHLVYLSVFNNENWIAIDHAIVSPNLEATFKHLGRDILYMPVYWGRNGAIPCGNPFLIERNGRIKYFESNKEKKITITIDRKYPIFGRIYDFAGSTVGGLIEASDSIVFNNAVKFASIDSIPSLWYNSIKINDNNRKYRYWRYKAPNGSKGNIAEISFFKNGKELVFKEPLCDDMRYNKRKVNNAFDKKNITYYESIHSRGAWIGVDMGQSVSVDEIRLMPRNDDNHVEKGHLYRLEYFDKGYQVPIETKIANDNVITFDNVCSGALYILHDLTAGTEERIFSIDDGNIQWY